MRHQGEAQCSIWLSSSAAAARPRAAPTSDRRRPRPRARLALRTRRGFGGSFQRRHLRCARIKKTRRGAGERGAGGNRVGAGAPVRASALSWQEGKMHTQQMQPHKVGDVTGFNEVATRGGAAADELLNQMLRTCSPPRPRKTAPGGKSGVGGPC